MQFPDARLLIFAKAPEPGYVKTRLIPALGAEEAARLYRGLLSDTLGRIAAAGLCPLQCWCAPDTSHPFFQQLKVQYGLDLYQQQGDDLGERMYQAASTALRDAAAVLLIGGDCPQMGAAYLFRALEALMSGAQAVLGPAEDGGYVLLGLRHADPLLFSEIPWGTGQVLSRTRQRLRALGWQWRELATLWDLDRPSDLQRLRSISR